MEYDIFDNIPACEEGPGICALLLTVFSLLLIVASLPLSLVCVVKVVQVTIMMIMMMIDTMLTLMMSANDYNNDDHGSGHCSSLPLSVFLLVFFSRAVFLLVFFLGQYSS